MSELSEEEKRAQAAAWTAAGGFFQRFNGVDHACMPVPDWRWFLETARKRAALASAPQASQPPQGAEPTGAMREVLQRCIAGIDHLSALARLWEPDHSSGSDRRGWVLAQDARDDARKLLAASPLPAPQEPAAIRALRAIRSHWREFGPEHGFDETLERNAAMLDSLYAAPAPDSARGTP